MTREALHEDAAAVLERKKRVLRRWAIAVGVLAVLSLIGLGGMILDRVLKGAPEGGLEINVNKVEKKLAWLGSQVRDINETTSEALGLSSTQGVLVNDVTRGSPADKAGLERGDVILAFDGTEITDSFHIQGEILECEPGDVVKLLVDKADGGRKLVYVELGTEPRKVAGSKQIIKTAGDSAQPPVAPALPTPWGISVSPLTQDVRAQFGIPASEQGIVIVTVVKDSLADAQGLEVGDVVESINQTPTPNLQFFYQALERREGVLMDVFSPDDGRRFFVTLPDEGDSAPQVVLMSFDKAGTAKNRIVVASDSDSVNGRVFYRFASAPYFILYDINQSEMTVIQNPYAAQVRGMGIVAAQMLIQQKIDAVIVGGIGPQAFDAFYLAKVKVYANAAGSVRDAIAEYELGRLTELKEANLGGYGYSSGATIPTGGSPWTEDSDEEEGGYEGQPPVIPPKGKPGSDITLTAQSEPRANRPALCVCPSCGAEVAHPSNTSCADMVCPICGSQLMTASPGGESSGMTDPLAQLPATQIPLQMRPIALTAGTLVAGAPVATPTAGIQTAGSSNLWVIAATTSQVSTCVCPLDGTTVTHPIGIPCASLQCPVCGGRMISGNNVLTGGNATTTGGVQTGGKPEGVPPVQQVYLVPVASRPENVPLLSQGQQVVLVPIAGGTTQGGPAAGGQTGTGTAQAGRSTVCLCPMCQTTVTHPIGVPCSSLACPVCGSRLVNAEPGGASGGAAMTTGGSPMTATGGMPTGGSPMTAIAGMPVGGKPEDVPPVQQVYALVPIAGMPTGGNPMTATGGMPTGGKPEDVPPVQQVYALVPIAGGPTEGGPNTGGPTSGGPAIDGPAMGGGQTGTGAAQSGRSTVCLCPMCQTTVTHPIGVPCASLTCPVCGSRLVNAEPGGASGGAAMTTAGSPMTVTAGMPTAGSPMTATAGMPVGGKPDNVPPVQQVYALVPIAGGPTQGGPDTGGPTSGGPAIDGPAMGGGQTGTGTAQSGRSTLCLCPMCQTTVTHPIGVPCASLTCPVCGSRLVNAEPGGASGGAAMTTAAAIPVAQSQVVQVSNASRRVVIPSTGRSLKSDIAPLFEEARYFLMFDLGRYEVVSNPYYRDKRATGVEVAQFIVAEGGAVVICNNIGMAAAKALKELKVKVYSGFTGSVQQVLSIYSDGRLKDSSGLDLDDEESEHGGGGGGGPPSSKDKKKDKGEGEVL